MEVIKPKEIIETISNLKTGEMIYLVKPSRLEVTGFYACL